MALKTHQPWIAGGSVKAGDRATDDLVNPFTGRVIARVAVATRADYEAAVRAAQEAFPVMRDLPRHRRHAILDAVSRRLAAERQALAELMTADSGKPITQALAEVDRAVLTFSLAADEVRRAHGELVAMDVDARATGYAGEVHRFPVGPVSAISPFNFPLNLIAGKIAPAIAVGTTVVLKPPPQCPLLAFRLGEILHECGLPAGAYNVLHMHLPLAERLATDERFKLLSFTGSAAVGWHLKSVAGKKKVVLELGGNAAAIVHEDVPDLDWAATRLAMGAFASAGQVCIKVQRILVHKSRYARFLRRFAEATAALKAGDPMDPKTVIGPMIDAKAADRVQAWVKEAEAGGATAVLKGRRRGQVLGATILTGATRRMKVTCEEVFGPVVTVAPYTSFAGAIATVNDSAYGLQAGVFTASLARAAEAFRGLEVGGVIVNDFPTMRVDNFPYGGVKDSGFGREGVRYAMEDMTEPRMLVVNLPRS